MVTWALVVFAAAAVAGLTMAIGHFKGRTPSVGVAVIHGIFAATGLVLLLLAVTVVERRVLHWHDSAQR